jgi:hypothetical protein
MSEITDWEEVGGLSVDAGIIWLGDPCYLVDAPHQPDANEFRDWGAFCSKTAGMTTHQAFDHPAGHPGKGLVVSTGYGDGHYPVSIRRAPDGRVAEVRVQFISARDLEPDDE